MTGVECQPMVEAALPPQAESSAPGSSRLFHVYLLLSGGVTAAFLVVAWGLMDGRARLLVASLLASIAGLGVVSRLGWTRFAAVAYLAGLWLFTTLSLWLFGAFRSPAASAYAVVALGAALLFGFRGAAIATAVVVASSVVIAVADLRGWLPLRRPWDAGGPVRVPGLPAEPGGHGPPRDRGAASRDRRPRHGSAGEALGRGAAAGIRGPVPLDHRLLPDGDPPLPPRAAGPPRLRGRESRGRPDSRVPGEPPLRAGRSRKPSRASPAPRSRTATTASARRAGPGRPRSPTATTAFAACTR